MPEKRAADFTMFRKEKAMVSLSAPTVLGEGDNAKTRMFLNGALHNTSMGKIDWDNRISISLDHNDCGKLLYALEYQENTDIYHQYEGKPAKTIKLNFDQGKISLSLSEGTKEQGGKFVFVNMTPPEYAVLKVLLGRSIPKLLSWE